MRKGLVTAAVAVLLCAAAAPALAQYKGDDQVGGERIVRGSFPSDRVEVRDVLQAPVQGEVQQQVEGVLPFTGGDLVLFVLTGIAAIAIGAALLRAVRRRHRAAV